MTGARTQRQKAIDKAAKVFRQGVSTPHSGEKRKCLHVLLRLVGTHQVMLSELDPSLPRRWDTELLEIRMGLAGPPGPGSVGSRASRERGAASSGPERPESASDFEVLLFRHLDGAVRKKLLHGPRFSQGLLQAITGTSAYPRLLAEAHALDVSNIGVGLGDQALMQWLDRILSRQGSQVKCRQETQTIFDDLVSYCRFEYVTHTHDHRRAAQRDKAQEEQHRVEEARRQAAEARRDRERKAARDRAQHSWGSGRGPSERSGGARDTAETVGAFTRAFEHLSEARLYLMVARQQAGPRGRVRSFTRHRHFVVELSGPSALKDAVDLVYQQVWSDLQRSAETFRVEAARARDEAIRRAETVYAEQCEQAFRLMVDRYTS